MKAPTQPGTANGQPNEDRAFEHTNCAVCKQNDFDLLVQKGQFGLPTHVGICRCCGLAYLNPRWTKERYQHFYEQEYDQYYRPQEIGAEAYQTAIPKNIIDRLARHNCKLGAPEKVLDVGSGRGDSLIYFKEQVWPAAQYFAIEPSESARKHLAGKGIEVITRDADDAWHLAYENQFDVVIMRHVLEHFLDPLGILNKVRHVLKPNGIFYVAVPNAMKPKLPMVKSYFRVVHTYYFTQASLKNVLVMSGLQPVTIEEGDHFGPHELYALIGKAQEKALPEVNKSAYSSLKQVLLQALKEDKRFIKKLKFKLIDILLKLKQK